MICKFWNIVIALKEKISFAVAIDNAETKRAVQLDKKIFLQQEYLH